MFHDSHAPRAPPLLSQFIADKVPALARHVPPDGTCQVGLHRSEMAPVTFKIKLTELKNHNTLMRSRVMVYLPPSLRDFVRANFGIHIPAQWCAYGIYLHTYRIYVYNINCIYIYIYILYHYVSLAISGTNIGGTHHMGYSFHLAFSDIFGGEHLYIPSKAVQPH